MAELIQAISPGIFPYTRRPREKSNFARWLGTAPVNNDAEAIRPMLSLEDEIMLSRLRERPQMETMQRAYTQAAEISAGVPVVDENQYAFEFMIAGGDLDERV